MQFLQVKKRGVYMASDAQIPIHAQLSIENPTDGKQKHKQDILEMLKPQSKTKSSPFLHIPALASFCILPVV